MPPKKIIDGEGTANNESIRTRSGRLSIKPVNFTKEAVNVVRTAENKLDAKPTGSRKAVAKKTARGNAGLKQAVPKKIATAGKPAFKKATSKKAPAKKTINKKPSRKGKKDPNPQEEDSEEQSAEESADDGEQKQDRAGDVESDDEEKVDPTPTKTLSKKRKAPDVTTKTTSKRSRTPRRSNRRRKTDPQPDGKDHQQNGKAEVEIKSSNEEENTAKSSRSTKEARVTWAESEICYIGSPASEAGSLPSFSGVDDFDVNKPGYESGIIYNSSPSSEVPNITIVSPVEAGFTVRFSAFQITINAKGNGEKYICSCKQYQNCTLLKTCKHLLLLNGPRFEKKRLNGHKSETVPPAAAGPKDLEVAAAETDSIGPETTTSVLESSSEATNAQGNLSSSLAAHDTPSTSEAAPGLKTQVATESTENASLGQ